MALAAGPGRALTEGETAMYPPAGGWGNASGTRVGQGSADITLPGVTIIGRRPDALSSVYVISVPFAGLVPTPSLDRTGLPPDAPPDPVKQETCIDSRDQKQKIAKDLCDVAAAEASASGTVAAIDIGFAVGGLLTRASMLLSTPSDFSAYVVANQLAKDHLATLNLACIGKAAHDHMNCVTGVCKFNGYLESP